MATADNMSQEHNNSETYHVSQTNEHELCLCNSSGHICGPSVNTVTAPGTAHVYSGVGVRECCIHPGHHIQGAEKWAAKLIF